MRVVRQAIITKFFGPTDYRGSRVKATCDGGSITLPWDHALDSADNHRAAATALAERLRWLNVLSEVIGGGMPHGKGWAFLIVDR